MIWVGILASAGGMFCVVWVAYAVLRIKHVRVKRVLVTLEWLALTPIAPKQQRLRTQFLTHSLDSARKTWKDAQRVFHLSAGEYFLLTWNANSQDLYWANSFGAELFRLSQSLVPLQPFTSEQPDKDDRYDLIAEHINDFVLLAR